MIYPRLVYLELTNNCELRCIMCPNGNEMLHDKGFIDDGLFRKIIDEIGSWSVKPPVGLYNMGDSLLHKNLIEYIEYAKQRGINTFLSTNGFNLNKELQQSLPASGLNQITFSFEGEDPAEYERIRRNSSYERVKDNILGFLEANKERVSVTILIIKFGIETPLSIDEKFKDIFAGYNVKFYSYHASDWRGTINLDVLKRPKTCEPKKDLCSNAYSAIIDWRGNLLYCTCDYNGDAPVGNLRQNSLLELYNSKKMNAIRQKMRLGKWDELPLCKECSAPYSEDVKQRLIDDGESQKGVNKCIRYKMVDDGEL